MGKTSEIEDVVIVGKLDLYEDPETGNDLVAVYTPDGEEYVITNRKMVKKLIKYTEDDIDIEYTGTVREDPYSHIKVITVESYRLLQEFHELKPIAPSAEDILNDKQLDDIEPLDESILDETDFVADDDDENAPQNEEEEDEDDMDASTSANAKEREMNSVMAEDEFEKMLDVDLRHPKKDELDELDDIDAEDIPEDERARLEKELKKVMQQVSANGADSILPDFDALKGADKPTRKTPTQQGKSTGKKTAAATGKKTAAKVKEKTAENEDVATPKPKRTCSRKKKAD